MNTPGPGLLASLSIGLLFFQQQPPARASAHAESRAAKVLILGIDGLRADALAAVGPPAHAIRQLMDSGCYTYQAHTGAKTVSGPGWSSILTGVWLDKHNVPDNEFKNPNYKEYPHFFARVREARPALRLASIVDWQEIDKFILAPVGADDRLVFDYKDSGDARVTEAAVKLLSQGNPDVTFIYFADVDETGHKLGFHPSSPGYMAQIETVDSQISQILDAVRARPNYTKENWLIIVTSDHGGTIDGNHGRDIPEHREIPFIVSGAGAKRGKLLETIQQVDVVPTALAHLGIVMKPEWGLDGRPAGLLTTTELKKNLIYNPGAELCIGRDIPAANTGIAGWNSLGSMTVLRYGAPNGYPDVASPGPSQRGRQFFAGGALTESSMEQIINFTDLAGRVDSGSLQFRAGGFFGGFGNQRDCAWMILQFLDANGAALQSRTTGAVTVADRLREIPAKDKDGKAVAGTGLLPREQVAPVPVGARYVKLTLRAEAGEGSNDGYADNLYFQLEEKQD